MLGRKQARHLTRRLLSWSLPHTEPTPATRHQGSPFWTSQPEKPQRTVTPLFEIGDDCFVVENGSQDWLTISKFQKRFLLPLLPLTALLAVIAGLNYGLLGLRLQYGLDRMEQRVSWRFVYMVIEFSAVVPELVKLFIDVLVVVIRKHRPRLLALGNSLPGVDVVICCCGEDVDVILDTVRAALDLDYPADRLRITVSDDGDCAELKRSVTTLACCPGAPELFYTARAKTPETRNKASNLNHAYGFAKALSSDGFILFAGLDADMIPERSWLRASVAHLLEDSRVGLTQVAPSSYNQPVDDMLQQSLNVFQYLPERAADMANCAWCTGSGWVVRRTAVESVGGFSAASIAEDVLFASLLTAEGWKIAYLPEALQFGLVPDTFDGHVKQYTRWSVGTIEVGIQLGMWLSNKARRNMSLLQRLFAAYPPFADTRLIFYNVWTWCSVIILIRRVAFVPQVDPQQFAQLVRASAAALVTFCLHVMSTSVASTGWMQMRRPANEAWMAPYRTAAHFRTFVLPKWFGGRRMRFVATGSLPNELHERDISRRAPLHKRLAVVLLRHGAWYHAAFVISCWAGVAMAICRATQKESPRSTAFLTYLLTHVGWAPLSWLQHSTAFLVPIWYAVSPPNVPDRETMLDRDGLTGVARPEDEYRRMRWSRAWGSELVILGLFGYGLSLLWVWRE